MKKFGAVLLAGASLVLFGVLVYYGYRGRHGPPTRQELPRRQRLKVVYLDRSKTRLRDGIDAEFWQSIPSTRVRLVPQLVVLPWPKGAVRQLEVKAFRNDSEILFFLSWEDETEDRRLDVGRFSDACAIMFPLEEITGSATLMMGFLGRNNVWQWKASLDTDYWHSPNAQIAYTDFRYPYEDRETLPIFKRRVRTAVDDHLAVGVGTLTRKPVQRLHGRGLWKDNRWTVLIKRELNAQNPEYDATFDSTRKALCAFAVWNGSAGDRGGRKSISDWVELDL